MWFSESSFNYRPSVMLLSLVVLSVSGIGCRGFQYGHLVRPEKQDLVGSHTAGSAVYKPLVEEAVAKLLGACEVTPAAASFGPDGLPHPAHLHGRVAAPVGSLPLQDV